MLLDVKYETSKINDHEIFGAAFHVSTPTLASCMHIL